MNESTKNIASLLLKRLNGELTPDEAILLNRWIEDPNRSELALDEVLEEEQVKNAVLRSVLDSDEHLADSLRDRIKESLGSHAFTPLPVQRTRILAMNRWRKWGWAAAATIILLGTAVAFYIADQQNTQRSDSQAIATTDAPPGREGAVLTLADGSKVLLDSLSNGLIAEQSGTQVHLKNGLLAYDAAGTVAATVYNTLSTPRGRQYSLTLPDGSRVWLNAASSIRYPTQFNDEHRKVEVTGEVYFEVVANKSKPFWVNTPTLEVQVLGTAFNICTYNDEPEIKTTLLNGSIKVLQTMQPHSILLLKPGEQAVLGDGLLSSKLVDVNQVIDWKNGVFNFNGATLAEFMRQIARWYDLEVIYKGAIPHRIFKGKIGRDLQLSQITKLLTQFDIQYELSGNTITIANQ